LECLITGITHNGEGVARLDGQATFVPLAIPGETVDIRIVERKKNYQRAHLVEVIDPSPDRVVPACPYFPECGGCAYHHISYGRQLQLKREVVQNSLQRIGALNVEVNPVIGMEHPWYYRNKVEWHTGKESGQPRLGYYRQDSHRLIGIDKCLLISREMQEYSRYIKDHLQELKVPEDCKVTVRQSSGNGEIMLIFSGSASSDIDFARMLNYQEAASIYSIDQGLLRLHYGNQTLTETVAGLKLEIAPLAFLQVNHLQMEKMLEIIRDYACLQPDDTILDAYCGTGTIALALASSVRRAVGVESFKDSIKNAKRNAWQNNVTNCKFIKGACEKIVPELEENFDVVILDPPRAGCKSQLIQAVINQSPRSIIYVSCNPATLARDLAHLVKANYIVTKVQPIDMFPHTHHVECCVLLYRKDYIGEKGKKVTVEVGMNK